MTTIKTWLAESDPEKLLNINETITTLYENLIDQSPLLCLDVWMASTAVSIRPIARNVIGPRRKPMEGEWSGRVDMIGHPYSFQLWLLTDTKNESHWYIRDDRKFALELLTKESFDRAMVELFS